MQRKVQAAVSSSTPPPTPSLLKKPGKAGGWRSSSTTKMYLAVYNSMLVFVWGALLYSLFKETMHAYFASSSSQAFWQRGLAPLHQHFVDFLIQVQCMTSMDVVHAALGLTPSGLLPNLLQNGTRLSAVIIAAKRTAGDKSPFVHLAFLAMAFAWSNADAIRYGYYTQDYLSGGRKIKGFLTRARYTAFLWLYPIGAFAEAYLFYVLRQQLVAQGSPWAPLVLALLVAYPLGFIYLYGHMLRQRSKKL